MKINEKYLNCIDSDFYIGGMNGMITEKGLFISSDGKFVKDEKWIEIRGNKLIFDNPINEGQIECVKRFLIHHSRTDEGIDVIYKGKEFKQAAYYKIDEAMEWLLNECHDDLIYGKTFLDRCKIYPTNLVIPFRIQCAFELVFSLGKFFFKQLDKIFVHCV